MRDGHGGPGDKPRGKRERIFIQDFVDLACPFEQVQERFLGDGSWLTPLASAAEEDGESLSHADLSSHADRTDVGRWSGDPPGASGPSTSLGPWRRVHRSARLGGHRSSFADPVARWRRGACALLVRITAESPFPRRTCHRSANSGFVSTTPSCVTSPPRPFAPSFARVAVSIQDQEGGSDADIEPAIKRVEKPENWTLDESEYGGEG